MIDYISSEFLFKLDVNELSARRDTTAGDSTATERCDALYAGISSISAHLLTRRSASHKFILLHTYA